MSTFAGLNRAISDLRRENATAKVDEAIRDGLLDAKQREWGVAHAMAYPSSFDVFIGTARQHQADERDKQVDGIHRNLGLTPEQSAAVKAKLAAKV